VRTCEPPQEALAGEHAGLVAVGDALVLAEQVADLAGADADVTGRHVGVLADVAVELGHERLAEAHDLGLGAALRVEVGAALAAADRQPVRAFLKICSKPRNLMIDEVDARVEAQTALVGAQRGVELHAEAAVDLHLALVVDPRHAEDDLPLGLAHARETDHCAYSGRVPIIGVRLAMTS
jgi:hypothetical protein